MNIDVLSMAEIAGDARCDEVEAEWAGAYGVVAGLMLEGAEAAELATAA
jgi:hemoglobin-like flavoprotein